MDYNQKFLLDRANEKFSIVPKRDFGNQPFLIGGKLVKSGFVVTKGHCNVMPGAAWFQTIPEAVNAIYNLAEAKGSSDKFWQLMRAR